MDRAPVGCCRVPHEATLRLGQPDMDSEGTCGGGSCGHRLGRAVIPWRMRWASSRSWARTGPVRWHWRSLAPESATPDSTARTRVEPASQGIQPRLRPELDTSFAASRFPSTVPQSHFGSRSGRPACMSAGLEALECASTVLGANSIRHRLWRCSLFKVRQTRF